MALAADTPDETINTLLGYIGKALNGERTYIFEKIYMEEMIRHTSGRQRE